MLVHRPKTLGKTLGRAVKQCWSWWLEKLEGTWHLSSSFLQRNSTQLKYYTRQWTLSLTAVELFWRSGTYPEPEWWIKLPVQPRFALVQSCIGRLIVILLMLLNSIAFSAAESLLTCVIGLKYQAWSDLADGEKQNMGFNFLISFPYLACLFFLTVCLETKSVLLLSTIDHLLIRWAPNLFYFCETLGWFNIVIRRERELSLLLYNCARKWSFLADQYLSCSSHGMM